MVVLFAISLGAISVLAIPQRPNPNGLTPAKATIFTPDWSACNPGQIYKSTDLVAAVSPSLDITGDPICNKKIRIFSVGQGNSATATIVALRPDISDKDLGLTDAVFRKLGIDPNTTGINGSININWQVVNPNLASPEVIGGPGSPV